MTPKKIYYVYGKLLLKDSPFGVELKDFKKVSINGETFYPLLVNQYIKEGIVCYKMRDVRL